HPYIQITVDEGEVSTARYWKTAAGLSPDIAFRTSSMEALRGLIGHGFGVTILSDMVFRPWSLEGRRIDCVPVLDPVPPMEVGLIWKDGGQDECIEVFKQFLIDTSDSNELSPPN
ncbi:MAG: LysR substrate-binding domain-containing protein, partial [Spongiibacter sp.]